VDFQLRPQNGRARHPGWGGLVGWVLTGVAKEQHAGGLFLGGLGTILASLTVGLVLGLTPDDGRTTFRPGPPTDVQR
jgi:hypothetical protein